jgi:uncharacterized protein YgiM (DUF1202 family)
MSYLQCPNCGQKALSVATRCPRCQTPLEAPSSPRRPPIPPGLIVGMAVAVLIIVAGITRQLRVTVGTPSVPTVSPSPPLPVLAAESVVVVPAPAKSKSLRPAVADSVPTPASKAPAPTAVPTPSPAPPPPSRSETEERRYASTWVNVRAGPSGKAPIVRVLQPGESVQVDSLREGWYQVLANGGPGGYVDGKLVDTSRPSPSHTP